MARLWCPCTPSFCATSPYASNTRPLRERCSFAAAAAASSGSPSLFCTTMRSAHVCMRKDSYFGTALRNTPAYGCYTATKRTSSRRGTPVAASACASPSQSEWWMI